MRRSSKTVKEYLVLGVYKGPHLSIRDCFARNDKRKNISQFKYKKFMHCARNDNKVISQITGIAPAP